MKRVIFLIAVILNLATLNVNANVTLNPIFGSHMVLQRNKLVPIYGTAAAGENVTVTFNNQICTTTTDSQGIWQVTLPAMAANTTAQSMTITGSNTVTIADVLIGDVWVCSGQSNMGYGLGGCNRQVDIDSANFPGIRYFSVPEITSPLPSKSLSASWSVCTPDTAWAYGAVAFYFGRKIYQEQNGAIPIGLMRASKGSSFIDTWLAPEGLLDIPTLHLLYNQNSEGEGIFACFNGMIYPLAPFSFTGVIWYQGESREITSQSPDSYYLKQKALQQGWQRLWGMDELPLYIVLLANYTNPPTGSNVAPDAALTSWPETRIQQLNILGLPHTGVASAMDVGDAADIHPKDKLDVGERLALWALKNEYGRTSVVPSGPILRDVTVSNGKAICSFDYVGAGLMVGSKTPYQPTVEAPSGTPLARFSIAGATGGWYDAAAVINGNTIELSSPSVITPRKIAYACWDNPAGANFYNKNGLPAVPFYVDDIAAKYTITASAGTGGSITPAGVTTYLKRKTALYTITPDTGYYIQNVMVDGVSVGAAVRKFTFDPIYANHTISAAFAQAAPSYTISTSAGPGGSISPSGNVDIEQGASKLFSIIPNPGVQVAVVDVDGHPVGNRTGFTFTDIRTNHAISASFACKITAAPGYGGSISPAAAALVPYGGNQAYTITPNPGFTLTDTKVDGVSVGAVSAYAFNSVTTAHTISATFGGGEGSSGSIPKVYHLLFSAITDTFPASGGGTGDWATCIPPGKWLTAVSTPIVETIGGVKWEKNLYGDYEGYKFGSFSLPINCVGATVVVAVRPVRNGILNAWNSCVEVFYDRLVLGIVNSTGQICVRRNGSLDFSTSRDHTRMASVLDAVTTHAPHSMEISATCISIQLL